MGTFIAKASGTMERDGLPVPFKQCPRALITTLFTRKILFIICTGNMLGDLVRYMRTVPKKQKTNRKLFYAAKKRYTRCVVKHCKVKKINQSENMNCVKKHCRKEDDSYSQAVFL
jgi:hypothetical protein